VNQCDVIITYGWNRIGYIILRSLASRGLKVAVGDSLKVAMAKFSCSANLIFSYPSFYLYPQGFISSISQVLQNVGAKVYIPAYEEVFIVAKYREKFPKDAIIPITHFDNLVKVHRKDLLYNLASQLRIPVPLTYRPSSLDDVKNLKRELKYPVVIKTLYTNSAKGIFYAHNPAQLCQLYKSIVDEFRLAPSRYPLIQEYIEGDGWGVSLLFNHGNLRAKFTHRRLREKNYRGGTSTRRISAENPLIEEYAIRLLSSLAWHGVAMVEFKYNERLKKGWLIEVNPRFWGSLALPVACGVDFPYLLYKVATEGDVQPVLDYKKGVTARWILGDFLALVDRIINDKFTLKTFLEFILCNDDVYDDLWADDLIPFFAELLHYFLKFIEVRCTEPRNGILDIDSI